MSDLWRALHGWQGKRLAQCLPMLLVALVVPFVFSDVYRLGIATTVAIYMLVTLGLNVVTGYGGLVSLGHGALVAIGAYAAAILTVSHGWSLWTAILVGCAVTALAGMAMAVPALRLSTWYFALVTLAFAQVILDLLTQLKGLTGGFAGLIGVPPPTIGGQPMSPRALFWLVAAFDIVAFYLVANLIDSRFGKALRAVKEGDIVAAANGASVTAVKVGAFAVSAVLAGLAGGLLAAQNTVVTPDNFTIDFSIYLLIAVFLGGPGRLWGPVIGAVFFFLLPELLTGLAQWRFLIFGAVLIVMITFSPRGLAGLLSTVWSAVRNRSGTSHPAETGGTRTRSDHLKTLGVTTNPATLSATEITKRFGGVVALDGVSMQPVAGQITAIVGPNGSGKTTLLNVVSGYYQPDSGTALLNDDVIRGRSVASIARLGVGRTFQTPRLLGDLTVIENVMLGAYYVESATGIELATGLGRAARERREVETRAEELLGFVGLSEWATSPAEGLPHGQQRLVEIARALMPAPKVLLLDEPAAGLSLGELEALGDLLREIESLGLTVLIVEHHLDLLADIAKHVVVLDRGRLLAHGRPEDVFADPGVQAAYMGAQKVVVRPNAGDVERSIG